LEDRRNVISVNMMRALKYSIFLCAILFSYYTVLGCADRSSREGRVVDAKTGVPISDAFVIGQWSKSGVERTICFHIDMTNSDDSGQYRLPALWIADIPWFEEKNLTILAYKKGYRQIWNDEDGKYTNPASTGVIKLEILEDQFKAPDERVEFLREQAGQITCGSAGESENNVMEIYRALYKEALEYTSGRIETESILLLRMNVEEYDIGYDQAIERYQAGLRNLKNQKKAQQAPEVRVIEYTDSAVGSAAQSDEK